MNDIQKRGHLPHKLLLEDRHRLTVSAVSDVDSFDETTVVVYTEGGILTVSGQALHIGRLSVETGDLLIEGEITSMAYSAEKEAGGFFRRLFR